MWKLWSLNQHQKDWGSTSASTWKALQGALPSQWKVNDWQVVDRFTTLEAHCLELCTLMMKSMLGIAKASAAFGRLRGSIWDRSGFRLDTKAGSNTDRWHYTHAKLGQFYQRHAKRPSCLRKLLKIKWQDRIPDTEILKRAGMQSVHTSSEIGTVKMDRPCYQNAWWTFCQRKILYGELQVGKTLPWWSEEAIQGPPSKPPLKTSTYQT